MSKGIPRFFAYVCPGCKHGYEARSEKPKLQDHLQHLIDVGTDVHGLNQDSFLQLCKMEAALGKDILRKHIRDENAVGSLSNRIIVANKK